MTVTISLPVYDPAALAKTLREQGLPGQRSMTAIKRLRRQRAARRPVPGRVLSVRERAERRLAAVYTAEIERRDGETTIQTDCDHYLHLKVTDRSAGLTLLHAEGWRWYGPSAKPRRAFLSYLCGRDDGQVWAVRVPGTITSARSAAAWLEPAEVTRARATGKYVTRQGDVYAIGATPARDGAGDLPDSHSWDPATRTLSHPQHAAVTFTHPVRFVRQSAYQMGRTSRRACGD